MRPFRIKDSNKTKLWEQYSLAPETMRPYFLLPGKEEPELVRKIAARMDRDAEQCAIFLVKHMDSDILFNTVYHLSLDGKLIEMTTGLSMFTFSDVCLQNWFLEIFIHGCFIFLAGAYCYRCPISKKDAHDPDIVKDWFEDERSIATLIEHYLSLPKNPDGTIKKKGILLHAFLNIFIISGSICMHPLNR